METRRQNQHNKASTIEKVKINRDTLLDLLLNDSATNVRIGVAEATEEAANETKKRRLALPLTITEKLFFQKAI